MRKKIVVYLRVSNRSQLHENDPEKRSNLETQIRDIRRRVGYHNIDRIYCDVGPGYKLSAKHRPGLVNAGQRARKVGAEAIAFSWDRFIRRSKANINGKPTGKQFGKLRKLVGVPLRVLESNPADVPSARIRAGQRVKNRGGRPIKVKGQTGAHLGWKQRAQFNRVIDLWRQGKSLSEIEKITGREIQKLTGDRKLTGVKRSTAAEWIDRAQESEKTSCPVFFRGERVIVKKPRKTRCNDDSRAARPKRRKPIVREYLV
jgi:hypothetical protein